jgi:mono/diheme cytochrome c family protein
MNMIIESTRILRRGIGIAFLAAFFFAGVSNAAPPADSSLFKAKCAMCHGPDGKGQTAVGKADKVPDFTSTDVQKQSDEELAAIIAAGKGKMPAYGKSLKPEQINGLVAYIRSLGKS